MLVAFESTAFGAGDPNVRQLEPDRHWLCRLEAFRQESERRYRPISRNAKHSVTGDRQIPSLAASRLSLLK